MPDTLPPTEHHHFIKRCKNIVVCCDGTGNQFGAFNSNVVKLYTAINVDNEQVAYYHPGVGTMSATTAKTKFGKSWSKLKGLAFAAGFRDNVLDAYRYLMNTYNDGDHIFLFGFSRGAYTARALAGMIHGYGLLCKGNEGHIPYVWRDFRSQVNAIHQRNKSLSKADKQTAVDPAEAFKHTFSHPHLQIHFVGLWDTVSSVGWVTEPLELLHVATNPTVCIGRHALAIDERRCFYQDNLWGKAQPHQDMLQVWFPGVHSDVGGSYSLESSYLSNETLRWLLEEAELAGLSLNEERKEMVLGMAPHFPHPASALYNPAPEPTYKGLPHHSLQGPWWLLEVLPHRFYDKDDGQQRWRIPLGHPRQLPKNAIVHRTVMDRMEKFGYNPPNVPKDTLHPIQQLPDTSSNVAGFFRYEPPKEPVPQPSQVNAKAVAGAAAAGAAAALLGGGLLLARWLRDLH